MVENWLLSLIDLSGVIRALQTFAPILSGLGGLGTLVLAILYWRQQRILDDQTKIQAQQAEIMSLQYLPRISIDHELDQEAGGVGWLTFENIGEVPIEGQISLSLASHSGTDPDSPILDPDVSYSDLPDHVKFHHGYAGDWRAHEIFLEPEDQSRYDIDLIRREIEGRDTPVYEGEFYWLRFDCELRSPVDGSDSRTIQRLIHFSMNDGVVTFSPQSFKGAQARVESS